MENVFKLSNDDLVRQNSIHEEKINWENHVVWFKNKISSPESIFYVAQEDDDFIGYCRLDNEDDFWIVTIHIMPQMRNKAYGKTILKHVCKLNEDKKIISYIKEKNIASYKMFLKCNFKLLELEKINGIFYHKLQYNM